MTIHPNVVVVVTALLGWLACRILVLQ